MRWLFSCLFLGALGLVQALSNSGSRLLVVIEEITDKEKYSKFWVDLEGMLETPSRTVQPDPQLRFLQYEVTSYRLSPQRTRSLHCFSMASEHTTIYYCFPLNQKVCLTGLNSSNEMLNLDRSRTSFITQSPARVHQSQWKHPSYFIRRLSYANRHLVSPLGARHPPPSRPNITGGRSPQL